MVLADDDLFEASESITVMIINATAVRGNEMYNLNVLSSALEFTIVDPPGKHRMNPMNALSNTNPLSSRLVTGTLASFESQS